jgi:hypothetical protein
VVVADREVPGGGWCGLGLRAESTCAAAGAEVEFVGADGVIQRGPLSVWWNVAFERVAPVRGFASFRGQRNRAGPVVVRHDRGARGP